MDDQKRLRQRLSRLGKTTARRKKPSDTEQALGQIEYLGEQIDTPHGSAFIVEERFSIDHAHGNRQLGEYFNYQPRLAAEIARDESLAEVALDHLLFVDTETTGLVGGAGTIAFLIGVGSFEADDFVLRQFFLHDPADEPAMLHLLGQQLDPYEGFVTFNGRVFDVPLMDMRFGMSLRKRPSLTSWPHLDLLFPARRLWRRALPDCSLGTLERKILGVQRSEDDVPGEWIPGMYLDYLRTRDIQPLKRIVYHNKIDILSLVGLSVEILARHDAPEGHILTGPEALGVARWHQVAGRDDSAESAFLKAVESKDPAVQADALRHWSMHLKRSGKLDLAVEAWKQWHEEAEGDPRPCIELAKYYEWQTKELEKAADWTQRGMVCLSHWPKGWRRDQVWGELEYRLKRINRKLD